jgi:hypothetical protein
VCAVEVKEAKHIAIDDKGEPRVLCDRCHEKVRIFFEEVTHRGKRKS